MRHLTSMAAPTDSLAKAVHFSCRHSPVSSSLRPATSVYQPTTWHLDDLPPELHGLIIDHIRNDHAALKAYRLLRSRSQARLFEFFTRNLCITYGRSIKPRSLDEISGALVTPRNARDPWLGVFAMRSANLGLTLTPRCSSHLQPALYFLRLTALAGHPKGSMTSSLPLHS